MPRLIGKVDPYLGPLIQARVSPSQGYVRSLGPHHPNANWPHTLWLLVDTGASHTMVDETIIKVFNLPHPTNTVQITGAMVLVWPRMWPDTTDTAPNSPIARALQRIAPYSSPHRMFGRVTRQKICQPLAPVVPG